MLCKIFGDELGCNDGIDDNGALLLGMKLCNELGSTNKGINHGLLLGDTLGE